MTLIVDAGALYAQADADDPEHERVAALLRDERGPLVTFQLAAAEADYLILTRLGVDAELAFLSDLAAGTFLATTSAMPALPRRPGSAASPSPRWCARRR